MKRALLIDYGGKMQNHALMKLSADYKARGYQVQLTDRRLNDVDGHYDSIHCSVLFSWDKGMAQGLKQIFPNIQYGGTGWSKTNRLPIEIERLKPDYELYNAKHLIRVLRGKTPEEKAKKADQLLRSAIGRTTLGCINKCEFCFVPEKEGILRQIGTIEDILTDWCDELILLDNNFTADPLILEKLAFLAEYNAVRRKLKKKKIRLNITQGIDARMMTEEKAYALAKTTHSAQVHIAWDLMKNEWAVMNGIGIMLRYMGASRIMCYMLIGFNTSEEEDMYRFRKLREIGISPYVMVYNNRKDSPWLRHFPRWVNGRLYTVCKFEEYEPWRKEGGQIAMNLGGLLA